METKAYLVRLYEAMVERMWFLHKIICMKRNTIFFSMQQVVIIIMIIINNNNKMEC